MNKLEHPRGEANRFQAFMTKSPAGLRPDFVRFYILGRIAYPLGFLGHAGFLGMFWLLDLKVLAAFNIISIAIFLLAIWAHNRGEMLWPVILTLFFEIPVHAVLATVYIGLGSAFWIFFFTNIVVLLLVPFVPRSVRITACIGFSFTLAALAIFSFSNGPLQPIASEWVIFFFAFNIMFFASILIAVISSFELAVIRAEDALQTEFGRAEMLLHNILPADIALRLKAREEPLADQHDSVSVLFADLAGFTNLSRTLSAGELVNLLNDLFSRFDDLANKHGAEKIKTIGDEYMVATGLSGYVADYAEKIADLALGMQAAFVEFRAQHNVDIKLRIGVHSGAVVAGVIGTQKFAYDLWGDTVNVASRMESEGIADQIQISAETFALLPNRFRTRSRGEIAVKGHGPRKTYMLERQE